MHNLQKLSHRKQVTLQCVKHPTREQYRNSEIEIGPFEAEILAK
jgi:hypothetical protein